MTQAQLSALFLDQGIQAWGSVPWASLQPFLSPKQGADVDKICPNPTGVLVAAFPYYVGEEGGNLSQYARGLDYHEVAVETLEGVCRALREGYPGHLFLPSADSSPLPERPAALLAGLGILGKNTLVLTPKWGSYVFFGTILTDAPLTFSPPAPLLSCEDCGACVAHCPGGALSDGELDQTRCLSALTQYKGELTLQQARLIANHTMVWGCDTCQRVCPHNGGVEPTPLTAFREHRLTALTAQDLEGLTNRQFREKYPHRAFTWRGVAVLRRNLALQDPEG